MWLHLKVDGRVRRRPRLMRVGLIGLVVCAAGVACESKREAADDREELPRQVETRIDGVVASGWTLTDPRCPDFAAAEKGAEIKCSALAKQRNGRKATANID